MNIWTALSKFHAAFEVPVNVVPALSDDLSECKISTIQKLSEVVLAIDNYKKAETSGTTALRIKLLLEEVAEYIEAEVAGDLVEVADALTDIHYIAAGTEDIYGLPGAELFEHIHENNMSKLGADGKPIRRDDGKILKPDNYVAPDVRSILSSHSV